MSLECYANINSSICVWGGGGRILLLLPILSLVLLYFPLPTSARLFNLSSQLLKTFPHTCQRQMIGNMQIFSETLTVMFPNCLQMKKRHCPLPFAKLQKSFSWATLQLHNQNTRGHRCHWFLFLPVTIALEFHVPLIYNCQAGEYFPWLAIFQLQRLHQDLKLQHLFSNTSFMPM